MEISRSDQMLLRLREELRKRVRSEGNGRTEAAAIPSRTPLERLRLADPGKPSVDDDDRRTFVRALLSEQFGEAIAGAPEFERIAVEVWQILGRDEATAKLLDQAIGSLRLSPQNP